MDEQQQQPEQQQEVQSKTLPNVTADELQDMLDAAAARAVADSVEQNSLALASGFASLGERLGETSSVSGIVSIDDGQYLGVKNLLATELQTNVVMVGVGALILGAVIGVAVTLHWRGSRG